MKTTKSQVDKALKEYREAYAYHYSLPDFERWKNAPNLNAAFAKVKAETEAYKMGM